MRAGFRPSWRWAALAAGWVMLVIAAGAASLPAIVAAAAVLFLLPAPPVVAMLPPLLGAALLLAREFGGEAPLPAGLGLAVLLTGAAGACLASMAAVRAATLTDLTVSLGRSLSGASLAAIGLVITARAVDLPEPAGFGLAAAGLALALQAVAGVALLVTLSMIRRGAGTLTLARMGGLGSRMVLPSLCLLAGGLCLVPLPPGPGFAVAAGLAQGLAGIARAGLPGVTIAALVAGALLGVAGGFGIAALARGLAIAVLGRPRTPRAAAAEATRRQTRIGGAILAGLVALWLAPALPARFPGSFAALPMVAMIAPLLALGLAMLTWIASLALHRLGAAAPLDPAWEGGFAAPPPWLPFGEPATQATTDLAGDLAGLRWPGLPAWNLPRWRRRLAWRAGFGLGAELLTWLAAVAMLALAA